MAAVAAPLLFVAGCIAIVADSGFVAPPEIISPKDGATVATLTDSQKSYLKMPRKARVAAFANRDYRLKMQSFGYYPKPLELAWTYKSGGVPTPYEVRVFKEGATPCDAKCILVTNFVSATLANSVVIDNLEIARNYSWEVSTGGFHVKGRFKTEDIAPRLIRLPGVPNVRDLGGRKGLGGRRVKQGIVYRSAGLNNNASVTYCNIEDFATNAEYAAKIPNGAIDEYKRWKSYRDDPSKNLDFVKVAPADTWTLFLPELANTDFPEKMVPALESLKSIPDTFLGAAQESILFTNGVSHYFDKASAKGPAVMMQIIDSPADGYMPISAGGDYWWELRANGKLVIDLMKSPGNWRGPYGPYNYNIPVPLKKGKNLVTVTIFTGDDTWRWGYASAEGKATPIFAQDMMEIIDRRSRDDYKVVKEAVRGANRLDEAGLDYALNTMGIKTDIDLRSDRECWGMTGSPLGDKVRWLQYSSSYYGGMQEEFGREAFKKVFRVFLDERNYPIDFHCIAGQDRTGAVAFIINGLLGVQEEELFLDWEATGFWNKDSNWFTHKNLFNKLYAGFDQFPGKTINDRIEAYVLDLGFTKADIEKLRSIMLE